MAKQRTYFLPEESARAKATAVAVSSTEYCSSCHLPTSLKPTAAVRGIISDMAPPPEPTEGPGIS